MTIISQKLKSRRGASLILAMVFILMCLFVGGSVLAAATANGGRVADLTSNQQAYLSQRSAALLMADMLKGDGTPLQLTIKKVTTEPEATESGADPSEAAGAAGAAQTTGTKVTYSLSGANPKAGNNRSTLQRILVENALNKYRSGRAIIDIPETFVGFQFFNLTSYSSSTSYLYNVPSTGFFTVEEADNTTTLKCVFKSPEPENADDLSSSVFDMVFYFDTDSQISLHVKATYSEGKEVTVIQDGVKTTTRTTVIRWDDPVIEKGGISS